MINHGSKKYFAAFHPTLGSVQLPSLKWGDRYKYLGVQRGRMAEGSPTELEENILKATEAVCTSLLTDWQKVDALNTFVLTKASYYLSATMVDRSWCQKIDASIRKSLKKGLRLPKRTLSSFLHLGKCHGGLGLTSVEDMLDVTNVDRLSRCLSSPDEKVQDVAWDQLSAVVRKRKGADTISDRDLQEFLNSPPESGEYRRGDVRSLWSAVRKSVRNLGCVLILEGMDVKLQKEERTACPRDKRAVRQLLNEARDSTRLEQVLSAKDQGRTFHLASKHPSSSNWIRDGSFVSFTEYRFAIRGRLNLLPTKSVVRRAGHPHLDTTCPKCRSQPQTLGHVLNACTPNASLMRSRHNAVLQRLSRAVSPTEGDRYMEQNVRNAPGDLRPDMVVWHPDGRITIVDVTIPYEGEEGAFMKARQEKKTKYQPIADWLVTKGHPDVLIDAFVVGSLGSWDPENEDVMKRLRIGSKYAILFRKLCAVDAIKGSLAIWRSKG